MNFLRARLPATLLLAAFVSPVPAAAEEAAHGVEELERNLRPTTGSSLTDCYRDRIPSIRKT
jgi:hypothetical protein